MRLTLAIIRMSIVSGIALLAVAAPISDVVAPVAISSTTSDAFATCTADYPQLQPGTNYPNS